MKKLLVLFPLLLLSACVTDQLNSGFDRLRGKPISVAIDKLGVPTSERRLAGRHVYTWMTSKLIATYQTTNNFTTGSVPDGSDKKKYTATSVGGTTGQANASCKIEVEVDDQGYIRNASYDGDLGACGKYADALGH